LRELSQPNGDSFVHWIEKQQFLAKEKRVSTVELTHAIDSLA